ncbi:MAG: hypothetical protein HY330_04405 [Chloroflexi bacterium]|nr:hypothetical protein [Chloroflexota bacterium]
MGQRLEGYLNQFQKDMGYYLEEDEKSITLFKYTMGEQDESGKKTSNSTYNPVPIAIVPKGTTPKDQLIRKLLMMSQK